MRRINPWYLAIIIIWVLIGGIFIVLNSKLHFSSIDDTNLILAFISVAISILSLGLATMKSSKFKGTIKCWNVPAKKIIREPGVLNHGEYSCISFEIDNYKKEPINGIVINFRIPSKIYYKEKTDVNRFSVYESKQTKILTSDIIKFLGNTNGDSDLIFEHYFNFNEWSENRVIYITIAGDNIRTTTFSINKDLSKQLEKSTSIRKINLRKVKK
tara:strand:- start:228 stop:869 length:642 start_codon:yes stop_codon:yes gene_type:complete